jgi:hypothetical protein
VRFIALAILLTSDLLRECAFSSRRSVFDQDRRLRRPARLVGITHLSNKKPRRSGAEVSPSRGTRRLHSGSDFTMPAIAAPVNQAQRQDFRFFGSGTNRPGLSQPIGRREATRVAKEPSGTKDSSRVAKEPSGTKDSPAGLFFIPAASSWRMRSYSVAAGRLPGCLLAGHLLPKHWCHGSGEPHSRTPRPSPAFRLGPVRWTRSAPLLGTLGRGVETPPT